jgi:hypothetical protein
MNLQQSVVDMPVMALQFSVLLAFMSYVDQTRRAELRSRDLELQQDVGLPEQPVRA